tara:strand:+ start:810 stop:989 length:180 start_codon:yes stop_codon:yes gene_type:complete
VGVSNWAASFYLGKRVALTAALLVALDYEFPFVVLTEPINILGIKQNKKPWLHERGLNG